MIRSDTGEAHRLSLSARVLSAHHSQVKAKTAVAEALPTRFEMTPKQLTKHPEIAALTARMQPLPFPQRPHLARTGTHLTVPGPSQLDRYGEHSCVWPQNHRITTKFNNSRV